MFSAKQRKSALILLAFLLAGAGLAMFLFKSREPTANGQPLSAWLKELANLNERYRPDQDQAALQEWTNRWQQATSAVQTIGKDAIPYLLSQLRAAGSISLRERIEDLLEKQSIVQFRFPPRRINPEPAIAGFQALGPLGAPALPQLKQLLLKPRCAPFAAECLAHIGRPALPVLAFGLTKAEAEVKGTCFEMLMHLYPQAENEVLPILLHAITNEFYQPGPNEWIRLGDIGPAARSFMPWLEKVMRDSTHPLSGPAMRLVAEAAPEPEGYVPFFRDRLQSGFAKDAAFALARVGPAGVAALLQATTNQDSLMRRMAVAALRPEVRRISTNVAQHKSDWTRANLSFNHQVYGASVRQSPEAAGMERMRTSMSLSTALDHPSPAVRREIVQLLTALECHGAPGLWRAASDPDETVRREAKAAIAALEVETYDGAIIRGPKDKKQIALVFTGHEFAEGGDTILNELARHQGHASFFLTGDFLARTDFKPLIRRIYEAGHLVGPHSDKHLLYCPWQGPKTNLITREQFDADFKDNLGKLAQTGPTGPLPRYFLPPYEHYNLDIVDWASDFFYVTINFTPGTRSNADYTGEEERNFVSSQVIFDSILKREQQDPHGLNGFFLLLHIGAGPGRTDKFHTRFGELLDYLAGKGYQFVSADDLLDPVGAQHRRTNASEMEAFRRRYGLK